jgi:hypothetical protein
MLLFLFLLNKLYFLEQFPIHSIIEQKIQRISVTISSHQPSTSLLSPTINIQYQSSTFGTVDEPEFIHHCHPHP